MGPFPTRTINQKSGARKWLLVGQEMPSVNRRRGPIKLIHRVNDNRACGMKMVCKERPPIEMMTCQVYMIKRGETLGLSSMRYSPAPLCVWGTTKPDWGPRRTGVELNLNCIIYSLLHLHTSSPNPPIPVHRIHVLCSYVLHPPKGYLPRYLLGTDQGELVADVEASGTEEVGRVCKPHNK